MFGPLQYSYTADDEYDQRKLYTQFKFKCIHLFLLVPPLPPQMKAPPKKAVRIYTFTVKASIVLWFAVQAHLLDIPTGNNAWSAVLQQAEIRRRKRRQTTPEHPSRALFCLSLDNKLRRTCIKLVEWK